MSGRRVVVVGGGLAGITAALDLAGGGADVTLLEVRTRLGGAAYSFEREGLEIDNGQHVFLRCCTAYIAFLERLGVSDQVHLQRKLELPVLAPGGRRASLNRNSLPAPLHLSGSLARFRQGCTDRHAAPPQLCRPAYRPRGQEAGRSRSHHFTRSPQRISCLDCSRRAAQSAGNPDAHPTGSRSMPATQCSTFARVLAATSAASTGSERSGSSAAAIWSKSTIRSSAFHLWSARTALISWRTFPTLRISCWSGPMILSHRAT